LLDDFAPFGIQILGGKIYVTYAKQDADAEDDDASIAPPRPHRDALETVLPSSSASRGVPVPHLRSRDARRGFNRDGRTREGTAACSGLVVR